MKIILVSAFIILADQISKLFIKGISIPFLNINTPGFKYGKSIDVLGDFFRITFVENPGMAFGIGVGETAKIFLSIFSFAAAVGILLYLYKLRNDRFIVRFALALILGGALGNFIDRAFYGLLFDYSPLFYGRVVDFLDVDFFDFSLFGHTYNRWPIFNIADAAVTLGVGLLLIFHNNVDEKSDIKKTENSLNLDSSGTISSEITEVNNREDKTDEDDKFQLGQAADGKDYNGKNYNN